MKRWLEIGSRHFRIERTVGGQASASIAGVVPHPRALALLRHAALEPGGTLRLRGFLAEIGDGSAIDRLDDDAVLAGIAAALATGRARLVNASHAPIPTSFGTVENEEPAPASAASVRSAPRTWIEIQLIGEDRKPIPGEAYRIVLADGSQREGRLDANGLARVDDIDPGTCTVTFPLLDEAAWTRA